MIISFKNYKDSSTVSIQGKPYIFPFKVYPIPFSYFARNNLLRTGKKLSEDVFSRRSEDVFSRYMGASRPAACKYVCFIMLMDRGRAEEIFKPYSSELSKTFIVPIVPTFNKGPLPSSEDEDDI